MVPYVEIQLAALEISKHYELNFSCKKGDIPFNFQDGPWHRDTYNLNGPSNTDGSYDDSLVMKLKPFYYTCLIPLDDITEENGRTEFLVGSHHHTYNEAKGGLISEFFFIFAQISKQKVSPGPNLGKQYGNTGYGVSGPGLQ